MQGHDELIGIGSLLVSAGQVRQSFFVVPLQV